MKDESLIQKANSCYQKVQGLRGEKLQNYSKTELAQLTVKELKFSIPNGHDHNHHHDHHHAHTKEYHQHNHHTTENSHHHDHNNNNNPDHNHNHHHNDTVLSEIEALL